MDPLKRAHYDKIKRIISHSLTFHPFVTRTLIHGIVGPRCNTKEMAYCMDELYVEGILRTIQLTVTDPSGRGGIKTVICHRDTPIGEILELMKQGHQGSETGASFATPLITEGPHASQHTNT